MTLTAAKSQKAGARPISFILDNKGDVVSEIALFIRPEELAITFPSRMSINQTLGNGAWVDSFGEGLEVTTITGHTGWHTSNGLDGIDRLIQMKDKLYTQWHALRAAAMVAGSNPNEVKLRYVDTLNSYSRIFAPQVFEIKRSKSRPLLATYRLVFTAIDNPPPLIKMPDAGSGIASLTGVIGKLQKAIDTIKDFVSGAILAPLKTFIKLTNQLLTAVRDVIAAGQAIAGSMIGLARDIADTGTKLFRTLAAVANLPSAAKQALMQVAGAYSNAFCVLKNSLRPDPTYENYGAVHGASNCSSTSGGLPPSLYSDKNVFDSLTTISQARVSVSTAAYQALGLIKTADPVLAPLSTPVLVVALSAINVGVVVS